MNNCMVSIVVPAYNAEKYINKNINSLINQTYSNIELIYVNDGSVDNTLSILEEYEKSDNRIRVISQENQGAGAARNHGLEYATGKYLMVLDSDDYFDENMLSILVNKAEKENTDILIYSGYEVDDITGEKKVLEGAIQKRNMPDKDIFCSDDIPDNIFQITGYWAWNKLYRRDLIEENNIRFHNIPIIDDAFFNVLALALAKRIGVCEEKFIYYRVNNSQSQSANVARLAKQHYIAHKYMIEQFTKRNIYDKFSKSIDKGFLIHLNLLPMIGDDFEIYAKVYDEIKFYTEEFGLYDRLGEDIVKYDNGHLFKEIKTLTREEFIFNRYKELMPKKAGGSVFGNVVNNGDKVILYGAGNMGKNFFAQNIINNYCHVVGWVDKNYRDYQAKGLHVSAIDEVNGIEYDYVLIAVGAYDLFEEIKTELSMKGFEKSKWIFENK